MPRPKTTRTECKIVIVKIHRTQIDMAANYSNQAAYLADGSFIQHAV